MKEYRYYDLNHFTYEEIAEIIRMRSNNGWKVIDYAERYDNLVEVVYESEVN